MKKEYIFFDFDGTLVDTSSGIFHSLNYMFEKMNCKILNESEMRKYIGPPLDWSFMTYNNMSESEAALATKLFRDDYQANGVFMHKIYDSVEEMLKSLKKKGKVIALATSKPEAHAEKIMKSYNIYEYFDVVSGATFDGSRSCKKDVLQYAVDKIGLKDLGSCVLVGDTKNDVVGAKEVGMDCIGVLYGFGAKEELEAAGTIATAATPMDVADLID